MTMARTRKRSSTATAPWKEARPAGAKKTLSPERKAAAKEAARKTGRPYPNLVDNMWASTQQKKARSRKRR